MEKKQSIPRRCADFLFGGMKMSWLFVIVFAVATAAVTAVFMILPIFDGTSFREMGTTVEAWILFAIIIMTNCKKPLESALKTFVFFLVSQPLIYLFQVPFAEMGWQLFGYYRFWFILTLFTFPAAFVGWYLRRRDWLSLLILSPMIVVLAGYGVGYTRMAIQHFPSHLVSAVFCFGQILLYLYAFFGDKWKRLTVVGIAAVTVAVMLIATPKLDTGVSTNLPDVSMLSKEATITLEDPSYGEAVIENFDTARVNVRFHKTGTTNLIVTDGDKTYTYVVGTFDSGSLTVVDLWLPVDVEATMVLPDKPALSDQAAAELDSASYGEARLESAKDASVYLHFVRYGSAELVVTDGDRDYFYVAQTQQKDGEIIITLERDTTLMKEE